LFPPPGSHAPYHPTSSSLRITCLHQPLHAFLLSVLLRPPLSLSAMVADRFLFPSLSFHPFCYVVLHCLQIVTYSPFTLTCIYLLVVFLLPLPLPFPFPHRLTVYNSKAFRLSSPASSRLFHVQLSPPLRRVLSKMSLSMSPSLFSMFPARPVRLVSSIHDIKAQHLFPYTYPLSRPCPSYSMMYVCRLLAIICSLSLCIFPLLFYTFLFRYMSSGNVNHCRELEYM